MAELARAHHIRVVLCSELPAEHYRWRPDVQPAPILRQLNEWINSYAKRNHFAYADYYSVLHDGLGGLRPEDTWDGVHPNAAGYQLMTPIAEQAIAAALKARP
jgi:lysophospholipase L1-like esterase